MPGSGAGVPAADAAAVREALARGFAPLDLRAAGPRVPVAWQKLCPPCGVLLAPEHGYVSAPSDAGACGTTAVYLGLTF